jgi:hypothetical protein
MAVEGGTEMAVEGGTVEAEVEVETVAMEEEAAEEGVAVEMEVEGGTVEAEEEREGSVRMLGCSLAVEAAWWVLVRVITLLAPGLAAPDWHDYS